MPNLVRLYIRQVIVGFALSGVFVAMLLWANVANLWHLVSATQAGPLAVFMLFMFNGIVFAGVQFGIAVMRMQTPENDDDRGNRAPQHATVPVPVRVESAPRR